MTTQDSNPGGIHTSRSVLACGSPLPLFPLCAESPAAVRSARGLAHSKTWRTFAALLVFLATALTVHAQYSIDWHKIAGGGGTSSGGVYAVNGTIGQHDAGGPMTGGVYSLVGGIWELPILVQTAGAPTLHITNAAPGFATIWWTPPTPGFTLQSTDSFSPTNWVNAPSGTNNPASVSATLPARFYRITRP